MGNVADKEDQVIPAKVKERSSLSAERRMSVRQGSTGSDKSDKGPKLPLKKDEGPLTTAQKMLIQNCWDTTRHDSLGNRIYIRVFEKRPDLQLMFNGAGSIGREAWYEEGRKFASFLDDIVANLNNLDEVDRLCHDFGRQHVEYRQFGFKPDFWVTMADAMTTECLYLDAGAHPAAEVIASWGTLVTIMFSAMRDGYYDCLKHQRRISKKLSRQSTVTSSSSGRAPSYDDVIAEDQIIESTQDVAPNVPLPPITVSDSDYDDGLGTDGQNTPEETLESPPLTPSSILTEYSQ